MKVKGRTKRQHHIIRVNDEGHIFLASLGQPLAAVLCEVLKHRCTRDLC